MLLIELFLNYWDIYILMPVGTTIAYLDDITFGEIGESLIIGILWPVIIIQALIGGIRKY